MEDKLLLPHKLTLNERKDLSVTGVTEVVSFDEEAVILKIGSDTLVVRGEKLHMKTLSLEAGQVAVDGHIGALIYEEGRSPGGLLQRLFG